jgi:ketopantoate reductase
VINDAVVDRARQHGTRAPLNAAIVKLVHQFERGERKPSPDHYEEVLAAA